MRLFKAIFIFGVFTIFAVEISGAEEIFLVRKQGSIVFTNHPTSLDQVVRKWKPGRLGVTYYRPLSGNPQVSTKYHELIVSAARRQGLDPSLVKAVVHAESSFDPHARSRKGAMGLMQLMPFTARKVGVHNPYEPAENLRGGTTYLARLMKRYRGNVVLSLAAYNAGPQAVDNFRGVPPYRETRNYIKRVLSLHREYQRAVM